MKRRLLLFLTAISSGFTGSAWCNPQEILHFSFDGNTKDLISGQSPKTHGKLQWEKGVVGKAMKLDGKGACLELGKLTPRFGVSDSYTLTMWVRADTSNTPNAAIIGNKEWNPNQTTRKSYIPGWVLAVGNNGKLLRSYCDGYKDSTITSGRGMFQDKAWRHLTLVIKRGHPTLLYWDDLKGNELTSDQSVVTTDTQGSVFIGAGGKGPKSENGTFRGALDELRLYRGALSHLEIKQLVSADLAKHQWKLGGSTVQADVIAHKDGQATLLMKDKSEKKVSTKDLDQADLGLVQRHSLKHWKMFDGSDRDLTKEGLVFYMSFDQDFKEEISGKMATVVGTPELKEGISGKALHLSGHSKEPYQSLTIDPTGIPAFNANQDFSISVWVKADKRQTTQSAVVISKKCWLKGLNPGWVVAAGTNGRWQWNLADGKKRADYDAPADSVADGKWHHLVIVFDRKRNAESFYDGKSVKVTSLQHSKGSLVNNLPICLGVDSTVKGKQSPYWFEGSIDDVRIYNRMITPFEIGLIRQAVGQKK